MICRKLNKKDGISENLKFIGSLYLKVGHYEGALENYKEALMIHRELEEFSLVENCYNDIGRIYHITKDY